MAGGLAGGLAQGIGQGTQLANQRAYIDLQRQYADRQTGIDKRDNELHAAKMEEISYNKGQRAKLDTAMTEVANYLSPQPQQAPEQPGAAAGLGGNAAPVSDPRAPGLSTAPAQAQAGPPVPPNTVIQRAALTGDFLSNPDKLNGVAQIFAKHGLTKEMMPWMEQAYNAKKRGIIDAMGAAITGNGAAAAEALRNGGMPIEGDLTPASKDNTVWTGIVNGKQQTFDVRQLGAAADPANYLKTLEAKPEQEAKVNKLNAETRYLDGAKTALARQQGEAAMTRANRTGLGGGGRADRPEKIDAAIKRRDTTLDALSSERGDDGKSFVDPQKRMKYSSLAVGSEQFVLDGLGVEELTAKQHHKLTDLLRTAETAKNPAEWNDRLAQTFGFGKQGQPQQPGLGAQPQVQPQTPTAQAGLAPAVAPTQTQAKPLGGLDRIRAQAGLQDQLNGIRQALANPGLSPEQKAQLSQQANQILNQIEGR